MDHNELLVDALLDVLRRGIGHRGIGMVRLYLAMIGALDGAHIAGG
jgi:hypothetical protein